MAKLIKSLTNENATTPFLFEGTGIRIYSFEEALYHCYYYWKQSLEDCVSDSLVKWTRNTLGLSCIADELEKIALLKNTAERFYALLTVTPYFDNEKVDARCLEIIGEDEPNKVRVDLEFARIKRERGEMGNYKILMFNILSGMSHTAI